MKKWGPDSDAQPPKWQLHRVECPAQSAGG